MDYQAFFKISVDSLRGSGDYRVFAILERHNGYFRYATARAEDTKPVTIWCSNDYLGIGQHPAVLALCMRP